MAQDVRPRIKLPKTVKKGEIIQIKTLISHLMESGQRKDAQGKVIPRQIINKFSVTFNGGPVYSADIAPSVSANPYFEFSVKVDEPGTFAFTWTDDDGSVYKDEQSIAVT